MENNERRGIDHTIVRHTKEGAEEIIHEVRPYDNLDDPRIESDLQDAELKDFLLSRVVALGGSMVEMTQIQNAASNEEAWEVIRKLERQQKPE